MRRYWPLTIALALITGVVVWSLWPVRKATLPVRVNCKRVVTSPQVSSSINSILIVAPDGTVWGWGQNYGALLGPSARRNWKVPSRVDVGEDWLTVSAGFNFAVGIKVDGTLWGWTFLPQGHSLGGIGSYSYPPKQMVPGRNWVSVKTGAGHVLALRSDGTLWAWGQNDRGQVGDGTLTNRNNPVQIGTNHNWKAIAAGTFSSMGLQSDGSVWHWGFVYAAFGTLPDANYSKPQMVDAARDWKSIHAQDYGFLASKGDGALWIWGPNEEMLGSTNRRAPFALRPGTNWTKAAFNQQQIFLLQPDRTLATFDPALRNRPGLAKLGSSTNWTDVWSSYSTSFGVTADGILWTWGADLAQTPTGPSLFEELRNATRNPARRSFRSSAQRVTNVPWPLMQFVTNSTPSLQNLK